MNTLAERISLLLEEVGNSPTRMAEIAGVKPPSVSDWVNGKTKSLKSGPAIRLAKHFNVNLIWLTEGLGPMRDLSPSADTQAAGKRAESPAQKNNGDATMLRLAVSNRMKPTADDVTIAQYAAGGSMGNGLVLPDQPGVITNWQVSREWVEKNVKSHTGVQNLCIVTGFGPSMQPMFNPGDPLLVDTGVKSVIADGIYFFRVGQEGFIKQLQKIPTTKGLKYVAKSKNPDYDPFEITEDMDFEVLARVVRVWCGTDF